MRRTNFMKKVLAFALSSAMAFTMAFNGVPFSFAGTELVVMADGYPTWSSNGVAYALGDLVQYQGTVYECIYAHSSNTAWVPGTVPTLWQERSDLHADPENGSGGETSSEHENNYTVNTKLPQHMVTGYWHNFLNGATPLKISDVPTSYDMICVSFANSTGVAGRLSFELDKDLCAAFDTQYTKAEFIQDIKNAKAKGQHVIISVGGAEGTTYINNEQSANEFSSSLISIIEEYGFEGVDIDFEGAAVQGTNFIAGALRTVHDHFGDHFIITMAPETYYMHDANDITGAYFRLATQIKDILTICYPQFYNAGGDIGYGGFYAQYPTQQFITSLASMYIENGLRPDQLAIGVPSSSNAASNGYLAPSVVAGCVNSLVYKQTLGGFTPPRAYTTLRGVMTWSINWDASNGYAWANTMAPLMDSLPTTEVQNPTTTTTTTTTTTQKAQPTEVTGFALQSKTTDSATVTWTATSAQISSGQKYRLYVDGSLYNTYNNAGTVTIPLATGNHTIKATATLNGYETNGVSISVTIEEPEANGAIEVAGFQISANAKGVRTVYSVSDKINGKNVIASGLVYGLSDKVSDSQMYV